jgi:hypothetical protein
MAFVVKCVGLLSCLAVLVSPCAYDTDPGEPSAVAAIIASIAAPNRAPAPSIVKAPFVNTRAMMAD